MLLSVSLASQAAGPPIEEIRSILARSLVAPPSKADLADLGGEPLADGLRRIDRHARWFSPEAYARERATEGGIGVGAALSVWAGELVLVPYADGPLARLGIGGLVRLETVEGSPVAGLGLAEVAARLRGADGTGVRLGLTRGDAEPATDITVVRGPYRTTSLELGDEDGHRVVRIRGFVARETRSYLALALGPLAGTPTPIIIDLRDSPGGDLFEAMDCAALFLPEGAPLAELRDGHGETRGYQAPGGIKLQPGSLVLWVGPGTASAAEVFAGILRHHGIAYLVGERTYGKCSSQTDQTLADGSVLRFTNRELVLPDGRSCSGTGLEPDVAVGAEALLDGAALLRSSRRVGRLGRQP
jgi:carboxyl-terminal processing protease